jgi:hypothetical protein
MATFPFPGMPGKSGIEKEFSNYLDSQALMYEIYIFYKI